MLPDFTKLATTVGNALQKKSLKLVTAESCTGGLVAQVLTSIPGSSVYYDHGFVAYSNESKQELLGVEEEVLKEFGAVSEQAVRGMAEGALNYSHAQISLAVTGIAGPDGGTTEKPTGMVWFALAGDGRITKTECQCFEGDRETIRAQAAQFVLEFLLRWL
jgi:nicotinamide-nucleotide amidase